MPELKTVIHLIHALSKTEKRNFKLFAGVEGKNKAYMKLYNLILSQDETEPEEECRKTFPGTTLNATVNYLYTVLIKSLMTLNLNSGVDEKIIAGIQEIKLLFRKGLTDEGFSRIEKLITLALGFEKFEYLIVLEKLKLHYLNKYQFGDISEDDLVKTQSQLRKHIQFELNLTEHASLYELLNYRFLTLGNARNAKDKEKLNDLVFTEMNLAGNHKFQSFNLKKNHLLFQSVYFMMTGDNKSSLGTFYELNELFEKNRTLWSDSPIYYIQHLRGIMNNLHSTYQYEHMQFFIQKLEELQQTESTVYLQQTIYTSKIKWLSGLKNFQDANILVGESFEGLSRHLQNPADKAEVILHTAVVYFFNKNYKGAARLLRQIIHLTSIPNKQTLRLLKLFNLVVHFELNDFNYLTSGIRSLERELKKSRRNSQTEKVVLSLMKLYPQAVSRNARKKLLENAMAELVLLKKDAFERQLFFVFDFEEWIQLKLQV